MQRLLQELEESPLKKFYSLESNLKRERRVFTIVILLLICAVITVSVITAVGLFQTAFRQEEQAARIHEKEVADDFLQRRVMLTTASLVLQLRMSSAPSSQHSPAFHSCTSMSGGMADNPVLRESCDYSVQLLTNSGQLPSIEILMVDGTSAYGHLFSAGDFLSLHSGSPSLLAEAVIARFRKRGLDPLEAAKRKMVVWFVDKGEAAGVEPRMIGASLVTKDDKLFALVLSSLNVHDLVAPLERAGRVQEPVIIDADGVPLVPAAQADLVRRIDERLSSEQDGLYHWIPNYGWALRRPALFSGFGHMVYLLPFSLQLQSMRSELLLIFGAAIVLIALLCVAYRYWNFRFLTRIYSEAARALDTEMLNHLLVHATPVGLCIVRRSNLEIIVANPIARTVLGVRIADKHLPQTLHSAFEASLTGEDVHPDTARIFQFPFTLTRSNRPTVHIEITYAPAKLDQQDVFFCAVIDMTTHHQAEILLREAKLTSDAAAKAKVAFFASMSHEIRTPLSSLVGNIELVARGPLAPEQQARVKAMQTSASGLLQIVNDVLDFSKIDVGEFSLMEEWANITELLDRLALAHVPLASHQGLKLYTVFDRNIPSRLLFDPIRISQIVNNLLSNALKFTPSGKVVLRAKWHDEHLEISVTDSGLGIADELKHRLFQPFTQGDSNRLTQARGTGLGLSICARLTELMKGHLELDSAVGVGTRITIVLPFKASEAESMTADWTLPYRRPAILCRALENQEWLSNLFDQGVAVVTSASTLAEPIDTNSHDFLIVTDEFSPREVFAWWGMPSSIIWAGQAGPIIPTRRHDGGIDVSIHSLPGLKSAAQMLVAVRDPATKSEHAVGGSSLAAAVLIVEDNLLNRSLLFDQLTTLGARVIEATNGEEALARLAKESVGVVMTDIDMPVMDGFQLLGEMRKLGLTLPVYAVSASVRPEDIAEGRARGFTDYLTKPVPLETLKELIEQWGSAGRDARAGNSAEAELPEMPEVPREYVQAFLVQAASDTREFEEGVLSERALPRLRRWLHGVAGGLSVLGPSALHEQCQELRTYAREAPEWNDEVEAQARAIVDALKRMIAMLKE